MVPENSTFFLQHHGHLVAQRLQVVVAHIHAAHA